MISGFTFNRIVIIQSLESHEIDTGGILSDYISGVQKQTGTNLTVERIDCGYAVQFREIIQQLTLEAAAGNVPLLHVECHGDLKEGLEFANGSTLSWEDIANVLLPLNIASKFNLLSVFSACFGAHFLEQMGAINPAPCWCMIAPTESVDPGEILAGLRAFYSALFRSHDMGAAVKAIAKCRLSRGHWFWEPAEIWFEKLVSGYVEAHCNKTAARERARKLYRELKARGEHQSIGALLRMIKARNRHDLLGKYFDIYFITEQVQGNDQRFNDVKQRIKIAFSRLRDTGQYVI